MFTKEERLFIWKKVYEMIDWQEDGEYICVALRPELEEKKSMATEPEEEWRIYGWFGSISPETNEVRLNIVKDIIKELE